MNESELYPLSVTTKLRKNEPIKFIMSRRIKKDKKTNYYLYTFDSELLLIAANEKKSKGTKRVFIASSNSFEIDEESKFFLGRIEDSNHCNIFDMFYNRLPTIQRLKIFLINENKMPTCFLYNEDGEKDPNPIVSEKTFQNGSKIGFKMKYKNKTVLSMEQYEDDEFEIEVSWPLSVLECFFICLTTIIVQQ